MGFAMFLVSRPQARPPTEGPGSISEGFFLVRSSVTQGKGSAILGACQQSFEGRGIGHVTAEQPSWCGVPLHFRVFARAGATRQRVDLTLQNA